MNKKTVTEIKDLAIDAYKKNDWNFFEFEWPKYRSDLDLATFHYVLGKNYSAQKNWGVAYFHFEKSVWHGEHLKEEIDYVTAKKNLNIEEKISCYKNIQLCLYEKSFSKTFTPYNSPYVLGLFLLVFAFIFFFLKRKKTSYVFCVSSVLILLLHPWIKRSYFVGTVINQAELREGPSKIFSKIQNIEAGKKFIGRKVFSGHYQVKLEDGRVGWIERENIALF